MQIAFLVLAVSALLLPSLSIAAQKGGETWQAGFGYVQNGQERDCIISDHGYRYQACHGYTLDKQAKDIPSRDDGLRYKAGFGYVREKASQ